MISFSQKFLAYMRRNERPVSSHPTEPQECYHDAVKRDEPNAKNAVKSRYDLPRMASMPVNRRRWRRDHRLGSHRREISLFVPRATVATAIRHRQGAWRIEELEISGECAALPRRVQLQDLARRYNPWHVRPGRIGLRVVKIFVGGSDFGRRAGQVSKVEDLRRPSGPGDGGEFVRLHGEDYGVVGGANARVRVSGRERVHYNIHVGEDGVGDFGWDRRGAGASIAVCICWFGGGEVVDVDVAGKDRALRAIRYIG